MTDDYKKTSAAEAVRGAVSDTTAQSSYKTKDPNWFSPSWVKAPDRQLKVEFVKMTESAKIPAATRDGDIGFDVFSDEKFSISPGHTKKVSTGIQLANMPTMDHDRNRIFLKVEGRSGLASKGVFPVGGVIDPTYRGEIVIVLNYNGNVFPSTGKETLHFEKGDRIAQLVVYKVLTAGEILMSETDQITETNRGAKGFGSSGK